MRIVSVPVLLSLLACGGVAPVEPPPPSPPPPPPPEPAVVATEPPPEAPKGLHAVVVAESDIPVVCWGEGQAVTSCDTVTLPPGGADANLLDFDVLGDGPVELVVGPGRITPPPPEEPCETMGIEKPATTTPWAHARAVSIPESGPPEIEKELGVAADSLYAVDLEGDGPVEIVFTANTERGQVIGIARDGRVIVVGDDRRDPLPEDAEEQARMEYELSGHTTQLLGITDAGLDGKLELLLKIDGYESVYWSVVDGTGTELGGNGCAI